MITGDQFNLRDAVREGSHHAKRLNPIWTHLVIILAAILIVVFLVLTQSNPKQPAETQQAIPERMNVE